MSSQDLPDYQRLLAATDAIGEVGRAHSGGIRPALQHALEHLLAALDLHDGGIYTYNAHMRELALAAAHPADGVIARQGAQLALTKNQQLLPALAATTRISAEGAIGDWGLGIGDQADS